MAPRPPHRPRSPRAALRLAALLGLAGGLAHAAAHASGALAAVGLGPEPRSGAPRDTGAPPARPTPPPPLEPAVLALPITIQASAVLAQLEQAVPRIDSLDQARCASLHGAVCHQYVYRRDTTLLTVTGDRVRLVARLRYRGRVALPNGGSVGSCGYAPEPMRRAELRLATSLYWRTDWRLASRATQLGTTLADPCEVTLLRVDASPAMRRLADWQLGRMAAQVDSALPATADLRRAADSLWRAMQEPLPVDSAGTTWLVMSPQTIALAPIQGTGPAFRTGVTLTARPRLVTGPRPVVSVRPLPALTLARPASGLRVPVEVELPFVEVGRLAGELLREQTRGEPLRVTDVKVAGVGDSAQIRLSMEGRLSGELTLVGKPRWDAEARALVLDGLDYTLESRGLMSKLKATLAAPFIRRAIMDATGGGRMAVGPKLDSARTQLTAQLNRPLAPGVVVGGGVTSLDVRSLHVTQTAFVLRVLLTGEAGLWAR